MPRSGIEIQHEKLRRDVLKKYKTIRECAKAAGMPDSSLGHICRGDQLPSRAMLDRIAAVLPHTASYYTKKAETPEAIRKRAAGKPISQEHKRSLKRVLGIETPEQVQLADFCENNYKDRLLKVLERIAIALENN